MFFCILQYENDGLHSSVYTLIVAHHQITNYTWKSCIRKWVRCWKPNAKFSVGYVFLLKLWLQSKQLAVCTAKFYVISCIYLIWFCSHIRCFDVFLIPKVMQHYGDYLASKCPKWDFNLVTTCVVDTIYQLRQIWFSVEKLNFSSYWWNFDICWRK